MKTVSGFHEVELKLNLPAQCTRLHRPFRGRLLMSGRCCVLPVLYLFCSLPPASAVESLVESVRATVAGASTLELDANSARVMRVFLGEVHQVGLRANTPFAAGIIFFFFFYGACMRR